jgi:predicted dehydrogenase
MPMNKRVSRREFLGAAALAVGAAPLYVPSTAFGANDRITMAAIGVGGRGRGDMGDLMRFSEVRMVAVCDVVAEHRAQAKAMVDKKYGNKDCNEYNDFRDVLRREDIDAVMIATPDHWHAIISIEAMKSGKDVFCEKPETLTVRQGRVMTEAARRHKKVLCGGSQRVWQDYNWFHRMVRGGRIGEVKEAWVNVGGPSKPCDLPELETPDGVDWNLWLGPAPARGFHPKLIKGGFRAYREYSGGGMTDWGCHGFGGAMFTCNVHQTGPVKITPPDGKDVERLTYEFANGLKIYHGGGWGGLLSFRGTEGEIPDRKDNRKRPKPPDIEIPNYKGKGRLLGDFVHCVKTREKPFRDIEVAHRTATFAHLGNIAYWLKRPLRWNPETEEIIGDADAAKWLDRDLRKPWNLA